MERDAKVKKHHVNVYQISDLCRFWFGQGMRRGFEHEHTDKRADIRGPLMLRHGDSMIYFSTP